MDPATLDPAGAGAGAGGADGAGDGVDSRTHPDGYWTEAPHSPQLAQDKNGEWPCDLCKGNCCGKTPRGGDTACTGIPVFAEDIRVAKLLVRPLETRVSSRASAGVARQQKYELESGERAKIVARLPKVGAD